MSGHGPVPVITVGGYDNALSVARSLGPRGIPVVALGAGYGVRYSRFVHEAPLAEEAPSAEIWLRWLRGEGARRYSGAVVLPCNDEAVELVAQNRPSLRTQYRLVDGDADKVLAMLDKARTYEIANEIDVPAPRVWRVDDRAALLGALPEISYPCGLKPRHAHQFRKRFGSIKLFVIHSEAELVERFTEAERAGVGVLVTEIIPGDDQRYVSYSTYIDSAGRPLYHFTKRKPRQFPIHFGLGSFHVTEWMPEVAELGLRFVTGAGLRGPAVVEFKRDARDGSLKLIECNVRLVATNEIGERSGLDLTHLIYNHLTGQALPAASRARDGVRLWFPYHDVKALVAYRRAGELSLRRWLATVAGSHVSQFRWSDPMPLAAIAARLTLDSIKNRFRRNQLIGISRSAKRKPDSAERKPDPNQSIGVSRSAKRKPDPEPFQRASRLDPEASGGLR